MRRAKPCALYHGRKSPRAAAWRHNALLAELELLRLLSLMLMLRAAIYAQLGEHMVAQRAGGQHATHGLFKGELGLGGHQTAIGNFLDAARIAGMIVVLFLVQLRAGQLDLVAVDNDNMIACVNMGRIGRLVLATQYRSHLAGQTAQYEAISIDHVPLTLQGLVLRHKRFHVKLLLRSLIEVWAHSAD